MTEQWTTEDYRRYASGLDVPRRAVVASGRIEQTSLTNAPSVRKAVGRMFNAPGAMNELERRYSETLAEKQRSGILAWWAFEPVKLRLADKTFYTPDFGLMFAANGAIEFHEVKGHWEDDARVKIKVAARMFQMFTFIAQRPTKGGGFSTEEF